MSSPTTLKQRHALFNTSEEAIFRLIKQETGYISTNQKKIIKGFDSEVYEIETKENRRLIFKINHFGGLSFMQEEWAINICRNNSISVPRIYCIGKMQIGKTENEYTIQDKVEGIPFAEMRNTLTDAQIDLVLLSAGAVLRKIHTIKTAGFYQRHEDGVWDFSSWKNYANSFVKDRSKEKDLLLQSGFTAQEFQVMVDFLEEYRDTFNCEQPVLCHGDYLPEHIFIDKNLKIKAIIDFGMFQGNHPIHDLAFFAMEAPSLNISALIKGYGEHEMFQRDFPKRLLLHMLMLEMGYLAHSIREDMETESEFLAKRLRETLGKLSGISYKKP